MWIIEIFYFIYVLIRLRLEIPFYSREKYRNNITFWARKLTKRYNTKLYVHGKPKPGFLAANHTSYLDPIVVLSLKSGGAVSKIEVKDYLLFGPIASKVGMLWVNRENNKSKGSVIDSLNKWDAINEPLWIFPEGTTSTFGKLDPFKMGVFKASENTGHPIQPLVFCYRNKAVDWGRTGLEKDLFQSILDFYRNKIRTDVYCFWLDPINVKPGEAKKEADSLEKDSVEKTLEKQE